jgi:Ca2+-binding EF-hand superfamily protein
MNSIETEKRLSKLMMQLAEGERTIEISRQVLSDLYDFNAYQIFKNLDIEGKNRIDINNIIEFLKNKGIYINEEEARLIILFYDQDFDGILTYPEFINLVQSEKSVHKSPNFISSDCLSYNVDRSLGKLLEKEVELSRIILYMLKDLKCRYDFNIHDLYHSIKSWSCITSDSIRCFLEKNAISYLDSDIKSIIKRMDLNRDGKIDLGEFHVLLGYPNCNYCCPCVNCIKCGTSYCKSCFYNLPCYYHGKIHRDINSPNKNRERNSNYYNSYNNKNNYNNDSQRLNIHTILPNKNISNMEKNNNILNSPSGNNNYRKAISDTLSIRLSPERNYGPIEIELCDNCKCIPCICNNNLPKNINKYQENLKESQLINNDYKEFNQDLLSSFERKQFNNLLQLLMDGEKEIECNKIDLALKSDFNCEDAFRIFEKDGRGFLTKEDLKDGFNLLNLNLNDKDINLIMKRFDLKKKNNINFQEFFDMLVPFDSEYRNIVEIRLPLSNCPFKSFNVFKIDTIIYLKKVFMSIIDFENKLNNFRKNLYGISLKIKNIFNLFDKRDIGFFNFEDYVLYLKENGLYDDNLKIDLLFIRLDKNRNGKIELYELEEEMNYI